MSEVITAPFSYSQIKFLNIYQHAGWMHPFTCAGAHHEQSPVLQATKDGWTCPDPNCEYVQNWAHAFMADPKVHEQMVRKVG